jgi:hypothetical protein
MPDRVYVGLVHYPVYNKNGETIATSITNLDIHDIARCAATYQVERYYLIHPLPTQHQLVQELLDYWQKGYGAVYNSDRKTALERVRLRSSLEEVRAEILKETNKPVATVVTDARDYPRRVSYGRLRSELEREKGENYLLLFGTGWGMTREVMEGADYVLEPVYGCGAYNHLSVRSAVSIILDRLLGEKWWEKSC